MDPRLYRPIGKRLPSPGWGGSAYEANVAGDGDLVLRHKGHARVIGVFKESSRAWPCGAAPFSKTWRHRVNGDKFELGLSHHG